MKVKEVDDDGFQEEFSDPESLFRDSKKLLIVEFSGSGIDEYGDPNESSQTRKIIDSLAVEYSEYAAVLRIDKDSCEATAEHYGVETVPTVIFFKNGREVSRTVGFLEKRDYQEEIDNSFRRR